jgi:hypothetical protein
MIFLGQAISRPKPTAMQLMAEQLVAILPDLLDDPLPENAVEILEGGISTSMTLCDDFRAEIDATIDYVAENLKFHGISYEFHGAKRATHDFIDTPQEFVICYGWHALCSASFDCRINGDMADCDCLRVNETHIVETDAIQDTAVKRQTQDRCTDKRPCKIDEAPICKAIMDGQYEVDNVRYAWVSTFSYRGWCSILSMSPQACDQTKDGYMGDDYWAVCDGAPCTENSDPFDPERPLTCECRVEDGSFVGVNGSCTGDNGGIMSSSPLETWDFETNSYRIPVPGLEYVQGACAPLSSDP